MNNNFFSDIKMRLDSIALIRENDALDVASTEDAVDTVTLDVPLLLRMLEYAKEDAKTDMDLHDVTERMIELAKQGTLSMQHYDNIVSQAADATMEANDPCWNGYKQIGMKTKNNKEVPNCVPESLEETYAGNEFYESYGELWFNEDEQLDEAEYQGRKVPLGKPMRGDVKKFKVYVKNPNGNVVKVNFGDPDMKIKKSNPARRRSFRARHNCDNPGPRTKARYWSCRKW